MADPFLGEIRMVASNFAPTGWALCNGQTLSIAQNTALFSLLGTFYGGNGTTNFVLPNLQGRVPVHMGNNFEIGQFGGSESVAVALNQMPAHTHTRSGSAETADSRSPAGQVSAVSTHAAYGTTAPVSMASTALGPAGGSQPHENVQPFLCINFIIALQGIFPSRD